ncbi:MAG: hypothetical protein ACJ74U_15575 [Jatrophihabitantaceae bacterium]
MQFSLFGAEAADPTLVDLDGLVLAGGDWVRTERDAAARLSVLVTDPWRVDALRTELLDRGLNSDTAEAPGELIAVRTEITEVLAGHAGRWIRGATLRVPADLTLTPSGLRLWAIAAGRLTESGYLLAMSDPDGPVHRAAGGQLSRLGVTAVDVGIRGGPGWRITSARRLRRLAELIGQGPDGAEGNWPAG